MTRETRQREQERFTLRLPSDLHAQVRDRAQRENRSVNQQVVCLIQQALNGELRRSA